MLTPPFRHRADVERNVEDGLDAHHNPLPPDFQAHLTDQPVDYWSKSEALISGPTVNATMQRDRMLIPRTADIHVGDEIPEVRNERAEVISQARLRVVEDLPMEPSHRELGLELIGKPTAPTGSG